ncbi:MAG: rRNA maturation RNase YbeY [Eudoraea sp.]|uniref:rRNA maturation RNase YbeY n=1 Tax=Eudoraea sp. TaxID=1979955 RepID=UPI003C75A2E1
MIEFCNKTKRELPFGKKYTNWIKKLINLESKDLGDLCFIIGTDDDLLQVNRDYLNHDYFTDVITFEYTDGNSISGDIFISIDRVIENAIIYKVDLDSELKRVMAHGVLHLLGYGDRTIEEKKIIREKEDVAIKMFHVEQ